MEKKTQPHHPPMTQPQREAALDLIILSVFADSHVSLKEDSSLEAVLGKIGWESTKPRDIFFCNSMNRARRAVESEENLTNYLQERAQALSSVWSKAEAFSMLQSVLSSDGVTEDEKTFLARVKAAMA
jgi:hypothetical protein